MRKFALLAALLLAACAGQPVHPPASAPVPPAPAAHNPPPPVHHEAGHPQQPPPPYAVKGPLTARLAGAYMDGQEQELRLKLRGSGARIARIGDMIEITIPVAFLFDDRLNGVSWDGSGALGAIAAVVQQYDRSTVQIAGYTDTTGSAQANQRVSESRAKVVADVLARDGVAPARISAKGYGETHPLVPTGDNVNQPRNRRVEIRIVPKIEA